MLKKKDAWAYYWQKSNFFHDSDRRDSDEENSDKDSDEETFDEENKNRNII